MKIQESAENYLEAILMLQQRGGQVRSIDIAAMLGFSKPSISYAMKQFRENGYITMGHTGYIELTETGRVIAERVWERHNILSQALLALGVEEKTAREDACRIEHVISEQSFHAVKAHLAKHTQG